MTGVDPADHYKLAYIAVDRFLRNRHMFSHLRDDLVGFAMESIVRYASRVDPNLGSPSTYLVRCALNQLHSQIREQHGLVKIPRNNGVVSRFFFGVSMDRQIKDMNEDWGNEDTISDSVVDHNSVPADEQMELDEDKKAVLAALEKLDARSRYIVKARSGFGGESRTLEEIGDLLGLSRERVRQIEQKAMRRLRKYLEWNQAFPSR